LEDSLSKSKNVKKQTHIYENIAYGKGPLQKLDIFGKSDKDKLKPLHIFIHGGYWRALDKDYHAHMSVPFNKNNILFFNINYDLCPKVTLSEICDQTIEAIIWIFNNSKNYGGNNKKISISGHSAGAHLVSYLLSIDWSIYDLPKNVFQGAALISGIYNLKIVQKISVNKELNLSNKEVQEKTTLNKLPTFKIPLFISYGENEPEGWKHQSISYCNFLTKNDYKYKVIPSKGDNHFTLIDTLANENSNICKEIIKLSK
jgi:arylformamidase